MQFVEMMVDQKTVDKRVEICENCDKLWKTFKVCSVCKCPIKTKTKFKASECPIGKW